MKQTTIKYYIFLFSILRFWNRQFNIVYVDTITLAIFINGNIFIIMCFCTLYGPVKFLLKVFRLLIYIYMYTLIRTVCPNCIYLSHAHFYRSNFYYSIFLKLNWHVPVYALPTQYVLNQVCNFHKCRY